MPRNRCMQNQIFPLNTGVSANHAYELHSMPKSYQCFQGSNILILCSLKERHIEHSVKQALWQMKNSCLFAGESGALHPDSNGARSEWKSCCGTPWGSERENSERLCRPGDSCEKGIHLLQCHCDPRWVEGSFNNARQERICSVGSADQTSTVVLQTSSRAALWPKGPTIAGQIQTVQEQNTAEWCFLLLQTYIFLVCYLYS